MKTRINKVTGVIEVDQGFIVDDWVPVENENGRQQRIGPDGVVEENIGCFFFDDWRPKE